MKISKYFTLQELTASSTATRYRINNTPSQEHRSNLIKLAMLLDQVREYIGKPLFMTCAYRSPLLNRKVGGVENSVHTIGLAADMIIPERDHNKIMLWLKESQISFDQAISYPKRGFIHLGLSPSEKNRRQLLSSPGKGIYTPYKF